MNSNQKPKKVNNYFLYDFVKITGAIPTLLWFRPKVIYESKKPKLKSVLICSNHIGLFDPVILQFLFPFRRTTSLATKDLYRNKVLSFFFRNMHCIMVDKENFSISSFHDVIDELKKNKPVIIFPEGKVNTGDKESLMTLKSGAILMAYMAKSPLLPVFILPKKHKLERVKVLVGDPIYLNELYSKSPSIMQIEEIGQMLKDKEKSLYDKYVNNSKGKRK